jgi:hypothetical protein
MENKENMNISVESISDDSSVVDPVTIGWEFYDVYYLLVCPIITLDLDFLLADFGVPSLRLSPGLCDNGKHEYFSWINFRW